MSQKLASYGQWTYRGAWCLEIVAACLSLATGLALGIQAFEESQSATAMDLALASAPLFMVSIAELTKIPIATLLFSVSWLWKPVVLAFLLILAGITFETVLLGLERAGTLRELRYEELANKIRVLRQEDENLRSVADDYRRNDSVAKARSDFESVNSLAEKSRKELQTRVAEVDAEMQATTVLSPEAVRAQEQLRDEEGLRSELMVQRDREVKDAVEQFERQRDSYVERIKIAHEAGDNVSVRRWESELARLTNPRSKVEAKYESRIAATEEKIGAARAEFERLRAASPAMTAEQRDRLQARRDDLDRLFDTISADWEGRIEQARSAFANAQLTEDAKSRTLAENQLRQDALAGELSALEKERIPLARTDQIRRLAARWYGKKPEEVTDNEAGAVAAIWFGSLAVIAALAGPITAMVALALQRIAAQAQGRSESPLPRLLRRMLLRWRWRRVRTVKVPVEVQVEKEIERRVEVPVEKVIKEILYVPILTDDPEALRKALDSDLPSEVADLVKISAKRGSIRASTS